MKKIFFSMLLVISTTVYSQTNDTVITNYFNKDSVDARIREWQSKMEETKNKIQWENNTRGMEEIMRYSEKENKKKKTKAILYIVIGVSMMIFLVARLMRKKAEKNINSQ